MAWQSPKAGAWHAVPFTDVPTTWHPVLPPPSLSFGIPSPANTEMWLDTESSTEVTWPLRGQAVWENLHLG